MMASLNNISFAVITSVGLIALAIAQGYVWPIILVIAIITAAAFISLVLQSLKPKARLIALTRVAAMPLPKRLSPLRWFVSVILFVIFLGAWVIAAEALDLAGGISEALWRLVSLAGAAYFLYVAIFGSIRYFIRPREKETSRDDSDAEESEIV